MKKVIVDCDSKTKKFVLPLLENAENVQVVCITGEKNKQEAVSSIVGAVKQYPGEITIVALSALTNIAEAIEQDADAMSKVKELIIVGGSAYVQGDYSPVSECNFGRDPEAAKKVFENHSIKKVMAGLDVTASLAVPEFVKKTFFAVGMLMDNTIVQKKEAFVEIETEGAATGQSVCDNAGEFHQGKTNTEIVNQIDTDKLFSLIFEE